MNPLTGGRLSTFLRRQRRSEQTSERARSLAGGATSSWQVAEPHAVWLSHGDGSKLYDVDGNEYSDFHGGYGVSLAGHNHPAIVEAVRARVGRGTHFAQPTEDSIVVADNLAERFGQPLWRFGNSGTESTMDAVHLMRAATGRDRILKVDGGYHGHHDSVMVSVLPEEVGDLGPADSPIGVPDNSAYCASKAAVGALTRCLAVEWAADNIAVSAIAVVRRCGDSSTRRCGADTVRGTSSARARSGTEISSTGGIADCVDIVVGPVAEVAGTEAVVVDRPELEPPQPAARATRSGRIAATAAPLRRKAVGSTRVAKSSGRVAPDRAGVRGAPPALPPRPRSRRVRGLSRGGCAPLRPRTRCGRPPPAGRT